MTTTSPDDPLDTSLLSKADALIRRNRPDGVGQDAEELPLLTDPVDEDLPELTDTVVAIDPGAELESPVLIPDFNLSFEETQDLMPTGRYQRLSLRPAREMVEAEVDAAVASLREEMLAEQAQAVAAARAAGRADALMEMQAAPALAEEALQQAREEGAAAAREAFAAELSQARNQSAQDAAAAMSEQLIALDAKIAQSLNQWIAHEMPAIIAGELLGLSERLRNQTAAHLRATLLPELSAEVAQVLDAALQSPDTH